MDKHLKDIINNHIPKLTDEIVNGYAVKEIQFAEAFVDERLRCAEASFPEGLVYVDYRRVLPHEEYRQATESRSGKPVFDVARSDRYMVAYEFNYHGEKIVLHIYLPYVRDGGVITLKGATFAVSPVLADKGISFGTNSAFVQVVRSKMTFNRDVYHYTASGIRVEKVYVVSGKLHYRSEKKAEANGAPGLKTANTTVAHYLFGKYGVHESFRMFQGVEVVVGLPGEVNEENYPFEIIDEETGEVSSGWVVCGSMGHQPKAIKRKDWQPPQVKIAVRYDDYKDSVIRSMVGGFFYVADLFPERVDHLAAEGMDGSEDEIRLWRILLGKIIGGVSGGDGEVARDINEHYNSLDLYIDEKTRRDLEKGDILVDNLYELLMILQEKLSQSTIQEVDAISSMADKQLMVLRYMLSDINDKIFWMLFSLHKKVAQGKELTMNDVRRTLQRQLSREMIMNLRNGGKHGEVSSISSPGDNKFFKITRNVVLQTDSSGINRRGKKAPTDESKFLHATQLEYGSVTVLPKSEPTGRQLNPHSRVDGEGNLVGRRSFAPIIENVQTMIRRR